jgi:pyrophosphatase PpaX
VQASDPQAAPPPRVFLFDFDGTLADTTELIMRSYRHTVAVHLDQPPSEDEWLAGFGTPLDVQIARFARSPREAEAMAATYRSYQAEHHDSLVHPFPGVPAMIAELARRGVPLAIVTSKFRRSTVRGMELCGLVDHIPVIVTPEDVAHPKPHPEPVHVALERLGANASEAVFIGDSPHDIAAGRSAGTRTAAALWGPFPSAVLEATGADYLLREVGEVLWLLNGRS